MQSLENLGPGKKLYFASDMHLGAPNQRESLDREKKLVRWLDKIQMDAGGIFFLGDIFDFWFEYKHVIPKGYIRLLGKLAELTDKGIPIFFFTGNHDMWMFDFFPEEINVQIHKDPASFVSNEKRFFIGHGDGLGKGDRTYKILKGIFRNRACQWAFARIHPNLGISIAQMWSRKSRQANGDERFLGEKEWLVTFCKELEKDNHHDYYVFGHRHHPVSYEINPTSSYFNLGDWISHFTYGVFDGETFQILEFEKVEKHSDA